MAKRIVKRNTKRKIYDNYEYVGEVMKGRHIKLEVSIVSQKGVKSVNVREFYRKDDTPEWMPNGNGHTTPIKIPVDSVVRSPAAELLLLISKAIALAPGFPLEGTPVYWDTAEENRF
ncbi:hypothetical protein D3C71_234470 [compost metagenome]